MLLTFISSAEISMLIAVFVSILCIWYPSWQKNGANYGYRLQKVLKDIAMIIFIVGAGGAFQTSYFRFWCW